MAGVAVAIAALAVASACGGEDASSPSGPELAYSAVREYADAAPEGIFLVDREGKHHTRLTRVLSPDAETVSWSPTSNILLFESVSGETWTIRPDGSELTKIADGGGASWSPDGKMIAVASANRVEILSADGQLQKTISPVGTPTWSPDGAKLAITRVEAEDTPIFVAPVKGGGRAVPLVNPRKGEVFREVYWSPAGDLLAFESDEFQIASIWTIRPDGSRRKRLAHGASLAGWSPRGRAVLCRGVARELWSLHECPLDGTPWRPLGRDEEKQILERDRYSPDGRRLAHVTVNGAIVVSRADGSRRKVLTRPNSHTLPEWSPDGDRLAFIQEETGASDDEAISWVYVMDRNGRGARRLVRGESAAWLPSGAGLLVQLIDAPFGAQVQKNIVVVTLDGTRRALAQGWRPVLAPGGEKVAYSKNSTKDVYGSSLPSVIAVIETRGGPEREIVDIYPAGEEVHDVAWSSDGKALLAVEWDPDQDEWAGDLDPPAIHEVTLAGRSRVVATAVMLDSEIAVSPNDGRLAFVSRQGLEVVDLETRKRRIVVPVKTPEEWTDALMDPRWSPDGETIAYINDVSETLETVRPDGSGRKRVSAPGEAVHSFSWRPSGAED